MKRVWALPVNPLYRLAAAAKNYAYDHGRLTPARLTRPVISVGSLSAGGAGKTPAVQALAELLTRHGYSVDVLSRGYGRTSAATLKVNPAGDPRDFGDEPLELAQAGLSVFVGTTRYAAGALAEATDPNTIHLVDDGFQHRRLHRTFDIVLVTLADLHDRLLPAGNLREPLTSLRRADAILLREDEADAVYAVTSRITKAKHWVIRRALVMPSTLPSNPVAFCGLARPGAFFSMLPPTSAQIAFPDHHPYAPADIARLRTLGAAFVTTAKDAVKLPAEFRAQVTVARLQTTFVHEDTVLRQLRKVLP